MDVVREVQLATCKEYVMIKVNYQVAAKWSELVKTYVMIKVNRQVEAIWSELVKRCVMIKANHQVEAIWSELVKRCVMIKANHQVEAIWSELVSKMTLHLNTQQQFYIKILICNHKEHILVMHKKMDLFMKWCQMVVAKW